MAAVLGRISFVVVRASTASHISRGNVCSNLSRGAQGLFERKDRDGGCLGQALGQVESQMPVPCVQIKYVTPMSRWRS